MNNIKTLSEQLGSLQITEEASNDYKQMDTKMSEVPVPAVVSENIQTGIPKNIILDLGWFDGDQIKFEDW